MKMTVHAVLYGCSLTSDPLSEQLANELKQKLEEKGISCYTRPVDAK